MAILRSLDFDCMGSVREFYTVKGHDLTYAFKVTLFNVSVVN